jgi:predicted TPR repeat methyltransferase
MSGSKWLKQVYAARNTHEIAAAYNGWADQYDRDIFEVGYMPPAAMCGMICRHVKNLDSLMLDAGAGTGILGRSLALLGFTQIHGIDISDKMLERAHRSGAYCSVRPMTLGEPLDLPSQHFDVVTSMGVFTEGHAPPEAWVELTRVAKSGGLLIFTGRAEPYLREPLMAVLRSLVEQGKLRAVEATKPFSSMPLGDEAWVLNEVHVYRVL